MNITVLGAGLVGSAIIKDLAREPGWQIRAVDINDRLLTKLRQDARVETSRADISMPGVISDLVADSDLVVCAVPGFMGFETLKQVIEAGKDVVDISFFDEDPFLLDELALARDVTAVVDCGIAPGLSNIILGYVDIRLQETQRFTCYVGGLPRVRQWPFEYKVVFSPTDVLEEYTRPSRFVEYGHVVTRPALSEVELLDFPGVGTLEAFNTDGLRSLLQTMAIPFMKEKTLRYPGHAELMRAFRESGFFGSEPLEIKGAAIRPIDLTAKLLFEQWRLEEGEEDLTVLQVEIEGMEDGKHVRHRYDLLDTYDRSTQTTSMARTTGYTCAIVARQAARGLFARKGICPPEYVGRAEGCFEDLLAGYRRRGIHLLHTQVLLPTGREPRPYGDHEIRSSVQPRVE